MVGMNNDQPTRAQSTDLMNNRYRIYFWEYLNPSKEEASMDDRESEKEKNMKINK